MTKTKEGMDASGLPAPAADLLVICDTNSTYS